MTGEQGAPPGTLAGKRVLVTRAPHQASVLADRLRESGAEPVLIPTIAIAEPHSLAALDAALACLETYDWMVFTSANAVEAFHRRAQFHRITQLPRRIAAIGPATERAANAVGLAVDLVPDKSVAESLAEALLPQASGSRFLLVRAAEARDLIPDALRNAGGAVTVAEAYRNEVPASSVAALRELFATRESLPDAATFTSASTARNLAALLEEAGLVLPETVVRASIGPITSAAMRDLGMASHLEAGEPSPAALVQALAAYFAAR
ncbi:MAG: uroporphyrinogen-III synthase [Acidobacteriota bacterium]|nr:uroporphyrinogen-III synthase [Acidobacteriota bacterium]